MTEPSFTIPARPDRRYPAGGGLEYDGSTVFRLEPAVDWDDEGLERLVESVLSAGPYRAGDFLELPMTLWLVRDDGCGDVFRVSVRDGAVRLHVLPATESDGLRRFYERLAERSGCEWTVECRTDAD